MPIALVENRTHTVQPELGVLLQPKNRSEDGTTLVGEWRDVIEPCRDPQRSD